MQPKRTRLATSVVILLGMGLVALGMWLPQPTVYITGIVLIVATICVKVVPELRDREPRRKLRAALAGLVAMGVGALAIVVPRNAALTLTEPDTIWSAQIEGATSMTTAPGMRSGGVLLTHGSGRLDVRDLETGEALWQHVDSDAFQIYISNDGHVLTRGDSLTWLSPEGEKLWERATSEIPVAALGDVVVLRDCKEETGCQFLAVDAEENVVFGYGTEGDLLAQVPYSLAPTTSTNVEHDWSRSPYGSIHLPAVAVLDADGETAVLLDVSSRETIEIESTTPSAISGDVVMHRVSQDEDARMCEMAGTQGDGEELWREQMPCASWGIVIEDRYYGAIPNDEEDGDADDESLQDTLTVDLRSGTWRQHGPAANWNEGHDSQTAILGAEMIIERDDSELTAIDPDTGDELWQTTIPGERTPGVTIAHGGVTTLNYATPTLNPFTARHSGATIRVLDGQTGETVSQYVRDSVPWSLMPVGTDRAIVNEVGGVLLLGR